MTRADAREIGTFAAVVAAATAGYLLFRPPAPVATTPVPIVMEASEDLHPDGSYFDVSREGTLLVYRRSGMDGTSELWARRLPASGAERLAGTEGAGPPRLSPDGAWVAFVADGASPEVRVLELAGGGPRTVAAEAGSLDVGWSDDGSSLIYTNGDGGLSRVSISGGPHEILTRVDPSSESVHWGAESLPGDEALFFTETVGEDDPRVQLLDLRSGEIRELWSGTLPRYSATGHLLFGAIDAASLQVVGFDRRALVLDGSPERVLDGSSWQRGRPLYAVTVSGELVYARPRDERTVSPEWVERDGTRRAVSGIGPLGAHPTFSSLALSPGDDRLAFSAPSEDGAWHLWVAELSGARGPPRRVTHEGRLNYRPVWSADGATLTFVSDRAGQGDLWSLRLDGEGVRRVLDRPGVVRNGFVSPDGAWLIFREGEAPVADIFALRAPFTGSDLVPIAASAAGERSPAMSPDGRWVAYTADGGGRWNVWVTPLDPADQRRWQVSSDGGEEPAWSPSGSELFYRTEAGRMVVVAVGGAEEPVFGPARDLFSTGAFLASDGQPQYDVSADGRRFLMLALDEGRRVQLVRMAGGFGTAR